MRIGIHVSIAGGMEKMAWTAASLGCEAVQIFSRSPRGGKAKPIPTAEAEAAKEVLAKEGIRPLVVHVPYFLNLASSDPEKRKYSVEVLVEDLERTESLGGAYLVTHVGHKDPGEDPEAPEALARVLGSIEGALSRYRGPVRLLLENTAGQGQEIGSSFEAISALIKNSPAGRVGACLDTCHAFAAGYDLRGEAGVHQVLTTFDRIIGIDVLFAVHVNDSKGDLGSHIDRHEHIGMGRLGEETFRALVRSPLLPSEIPGLLETPRDVPEDDLRNVNALKGFRSASR